MALTIRLEPEIEQRINDLAEQTGRTKAFYLRELILNGLDDLEDLYIADQRMIEIRAGRSKTFTLEEVMKEYGMDN